MGAKSRPRRAPSGQPAPPARAAPPPPAPPPPAPPPPALPTALLRPELPTAVGSLGWLAITAVLGLARLFGDRPLDIWFWTSVCGWALALIGFAIIWWQRSAARRGSRLAQSGLL